MGLETKGTPVSLGDVGGDLSPAPGASTMASEEQPAIICSAGLKQLISIRDTRCPEHREWEARAGEHGETDGETDPHPCHEGRMRETYDKEDAGFRNRAECCGGRKQGETTRENTWADRKGAQGGTC